jgi:hypothetical protein
MAWLPRFEGGIGRWVYVAAVPAIFLSQHVVVALEAALLGQELPWNATFFLLPLQSFTHLPDLPIWAAVLAVMVALGATGLLATLAFRRATVSAGGYALAAFALVPVLQLVALAILAVLPPRAEGDSDPPDAPANVAAIIRGVLTGMTLIMLAVTISALLFGAYGWGLFVLTPFVVGMTTAYVANRDGVIGAGRSQALVISAAGLGCLMLIAAALEGIICIILAAPIGLGVALLGGAIGRRMAIARHGGSAPLACVAILPLVFALEAALPPSVAIRSTASIDIAAPPAAVWRALTAGDEIRPAPGLAFRLGLAYPIRSRLLGAGVGAERIGLFSTGIARERITEWRPGRRLAFAVLSQPPVMTELSPYAEVQAPHVSGYFQTRTTGFTLLPLPGGGTRLVADADHVLRLDPVFYWEPIARWAIGRNLARVLEDIRARAEAARGG